jgi:hypothetical protein
MTAVLDDLAALTADEIAPLLGDDDDAVRGAAIAEVDRRDVSRRRSRASRNAWRERSQPAGWLEAAHAQALELERVTSGYVLSGHGKRVIRGDVFPALWQIPEREIDRCISEEAGQFFRSSPRLTVAGYQRQTAASDHDEHETARTEAGSTGNEGETMTTEQQDDSGQDTPASIERTYAAPAAVPAHEQPGAVVLDEVRGYLRRFCVFPSEAAADAVTLWATHSHAFEAFDVTPRLAIQSSEPGSGKTRLMDLLATLAARPEYLIDITGPTLFTLVRESKPTLLMDEADQSGPGKRTVLGLLNAGYKRGASVPRMSRGTVQRFPVFCPAAFAGLGRLPDTLQTRCVEIRMRRRRRGERCEAYMPRQHAVLGQAIGVSLASWVTSVLPELASTWPEMPEGVEDRPSEIWGPLLAIAEVAGGHWPATARRACEALVLGVGGQPVRSPGLQLLDDVALVWPEDRAKMATAELVRLLMDVPGNERNWDPASAPRELAAMLRPHGIEPVKIRLGDRTAQGYTRDAFPALAEQQQPAAA